MSNLLIDTAGEELLSAAIHIGQRPIVRDDCK